MSKKISDILLEKAAEQLKETTKAVEDAQWALNLIESLKKEVNSSDLPDALKEESVQAIGVLESNLDKVKGLGPEALTLLVQQLSQGKVEVAAKTYVKAYTNAEMIIAAMDAGSDELIAAKKKLDQLNSDALEFLKKIAIKGAQYLLPFLFTLI